MRPQNLHATALVIGSRGVLIRGPSGSGKTTLALALIERFGVPGRFCRLVADDQLFVAGHAGRLVCRAPATIAGLAEVAGLGPRPLPFEPAAVVDLVVHLVPASEIPRYQEDADEMIAGCRLPGLRLAARDVVRAVPAIASRLELPPFGRAGA